MTVKIIILRKVPVEKEVELRPLIIKMRSLAMAEPGYISGETLMRSDDPEEFLVISTWRSIDDWNRWLNNEERIAIQHQIDGLLKEKSRYQVYYNG